VASLAPPRSPASPRPPGRSGRLDFSPSSYAPSPTTSRSARLSTASRCTRPPAQAGLTPRDGRHCCAMSSALRSRRSELSSSPTALWPKARLRAAHHPQEGLQ
jgi:hypothetical protein